MCHHFGRVGCEGGGTEQISDIPIVPSDTANLFRTDRSASIVGID
jgi:hypothetical protein